MGGATLPRPLHDFIALTGTTLPFTFATITQNTTLKNKIRTNFPSNDITVGQGTAAILYSQAN